MIGGQVGIVGHISIGNHVKIAAQSGIPKSIREEGAIVQGSPPLDFTHFQRCYVVFKNLPKLRNQVIELERTVTAMTSK